MKQNRWVWLVLFLFILGGCTTRSGGNQPPSSGGSELAVGGSAPDDAVDSDSAGNAPMSAADTVEINIPYRNDPAPAGVLEQLAWMGQGGPGGGMEQVCGDCDAGIKYGRISFSDFEPNQKLEARIYRDLGGNDCADGTAKYVTSLSIEVDGAGNFSAPLNGPTDDLAIVSIFDVGTGKQVWRSIMMPYMFIDCQERASNSCPGAPPQRLKVKEMARVCTASETVKLRDGPGKGFAVQKSLVPGADLKIIGGPKCADDWSWWKVETESGYTGWMSEGGDATDTYFLCPVQ